MLYILFNVNRIKVALANVVLNQQFIVHFVRYKINISSKVVIGMIQICVCACIDSMLASGANNSTITRKNISAR